MKMFGEKPVSLKAIVKLVVVRSRIAVFIEGQILFLPEGSEEGLEVVKNVWLHQHGAETAIVLGVVNQ